MRWAAVVLCLLLGEGCLAFTDWDQYQIVWQDEFDFFDGGKWQHEVTATGGGVRLEQYSHCIGLFNFLIYSDISIAPLQVHYYSVALPTTAMTLCRS